MKLTGNKCQCTACGKHFRSVAAFDKHRVGKAEARRCLTEEEMRAWGMAERAGWWVTAVNPQFSVTRAALR